jgi:hypothetical protein
MQLIFGHIPSNNGVHFKFRPHAVQHKKKSLSLRPNFVQLRKYYLADYGY